MKTKLIDYVNNGPIFNPQPAGTAGANPSELAFQAPYSVNVPLPGAPVLDTITGEISYNANNTPTQLKALGTLDNKVIIIEEAHNFVPSKGEEKSESPSLLTIRRLLTEGRKFGTGVVLISQRPGRLDETTLAQCNSFLVLKLVNPRDQSWVRNVMEQMSEQDKKSLKSFANGQAYISGHAVRFPLQVQIDFYRDRYEEEFQAILRDGVEYDEDGGGTVSDSEKEPLHSLRLVR